MGKSWVSGKSLLEPEGWVFFKSFRGGVSPSRMAGSWVSQEVLPAVGL